LIRASRSSRSEELRTLQALDNGRNTLVLGHPGALFPGAAARPDRTAPDEGGEGSER